MRMKEREKIRNHNRRGFTLAETLLALLILMMVSTIVATGIPVAKNAYEKVVIASNAEVLLSTAVSTLRNELGTAKDVNIPGTPDADAVVSGSAITYYNPVRGSRSKIYKADGTTDKDADGARIPAGTIMFSRYYDDTGIYPAGYNGKSVRLISKQAATERLYVTFENAEYNKTTGVVTFKNVSVSRQGGGTGLAVREEVPIRLISYEAGN